MIVVNPYRPIRLINRTSVNSVDPDQMLQNAASVQGLLFAYRNFYLK